MELSFTNGFNQSESLPVMNRKCTGWYPKFFREDGEIIRRSLMGTPGLNQLATSGSAALQANRGSQVMSGITYFVNGTTLNRLNADFTISSLGTIAGSGKVSMPHNGIQLMILVPGGKGYIFNKDTAVFAEITDTDFTANGAPQVAIFIDGYFAASTDSKKWIISALNDGTAWNPLDVGTAESDPDIIVAPFNFNNQAVIFGGETIEYFENIGGGDFPFQRNGVFIQKGLFARFSVVESSQRIMFIGGGENEAPAVWAIQANQPVKISNSGVDLLLAALTQAQLDQVVSYSYSEDDSTFVAWELPNETAVYGVDTGKWHIRQSQVPDVAGATITVGWRATGLVTAYDKLICFDTQDGRVGDISRDFFAEYGTDIQRVFDVDLLKAGGATFGVPRVEVTTQSGAGDATVTDPKIRMRKSVDGKVFKNERVRSIGAIGKAQQRQVWRRNGRFKRFGILRFFMSDAVRPVIANVEAEFVLGRV